MIVKKFILVPAIILLILSGCAEKQQQGPYLKDVFSNKFYLGMAMNREQILGTDTLSLKIIKNHCNSVTAENCMKSINIHPLEDVFNFSLTDSFVAFGIANNMKIIGHTLIWHSQLAPWFCVDDEGNDVSAEMLTKRISNHISTIVGHYKGKVKGWDVLNEAFNDNGTYRETKFYKILGEDYIPLVFRLANAADPEAELYYNDYNMDKPKKREAVVKLIQKLREEGIKIDGVGMQGHLLMNHPDIDEFEKSILAFSGENVNVMITELDLSVLPLGAGFNGADVSAKEEYTKKLNPYTRNLPDSISNLWNTRMNDYFSLFIKHHEKIDRVTLWGVSDGDSWKNNWPIHGRTDYPLIFDRNGKPKNVIQSIIDQLNITKTDKS